MPGYDLPDAACMIAAIEACAERAVEPIVGKPSPIILREGLDLLGLKAEECVMVGDRPETDMVMAHRAGLTGILVLSGVATAEHAAALEEQPDFIVESVARIAEALA
jgi:ribonucleotide monophosphatase NagD (HAD superfamily)